MEQTGRQFHDVRNASSVCCSKRLVLASKICTHQVRLHRSLDKRGGLDDWGEDCPRLLVGVDAFVNELSAGHEMHAQQKQGASASPVLLPI